MKGAAMRGYFGIGIFHCKTVHNVGCLWRSAHVMGASFIFTVGHRYKRQASDTTAASLHVPLYEYETFGSMKANAPHDCLIVGIEQSDMAEDIRVAYHPERAIYLLGAEDHGLPPHIMEQCHRIIEIPSTRCLNVAVAGSIVMYDRLIRPLSQRRNSTGVFAGSKEVNSK